MVVWSTIWKQQRAASSPALSLMLFLQLEQLPSVLTQLFGQIEVLTPRLRTYRLQLITEEVECYWTSFWWLQPSQRTAKRENRDSWVIFVFTWKLRNGVTNLKAQNIPKKHIRDHFNVLITLFPTICKMCDFCSVVALFVSDKRLESQHWGLIAFQFYCLNCVWLSW